MSEVERKLLENALDALDRLLDCQCGVTDVRDLMFATSHALREHPLTTQFSNAVDRLDPIVRGGNSYDDERELALNATNELRIALADALPDL